MLSINILDDEALQTAVERIISGLLPHEGFEPELYGDLLNNLFKYIKLEEFQGEYYALLQTLDRFKSIKQAVKGYTPALTKDILEATLESNIETLVSSYKVNIRRLLEDEGQDTNIEIEETFDIACNILATRTYDLFDRCMDLAISSSESVGYLQALEGEFVMHTANQSIIAQAKIFKEGIKVGRKKYKGPKDWLEYINIVQLEVKKRIVENDNKVLNIYDTNVAKELVEKIRESSIPLADYGLPPMDADTPMLRHRLVILVAQENVGKTTMSVEWANRVILNGHKVLYMTGENTYERFYVKQLSNFIYKKHGYRITPSDIINPESLPDSIIRLINIATAEFSETKCMRLAKAFHYDTVYEELVAEYEKEPFDAVFMDHSYALLGGTDWYERIGNLAVACRQFKNDYPVYMQVLSHTSSEALKDIKAGKKVGSAPTKGNASLAGEADEIFVLTRSELLDKQGLLSIQNYKRRDATLVYENMIVKKQFDVSSFVWDDKYQTVANAMAQELDNINQVYALATGDFELDEEDADDYGDL